MPADGFAPSGALVKATLLNSARQMTGTGAGTIPGNCQGWGRILLDDTLFFEAQSRPIFATDDPGFPPGGAGQEKTFTFLVGGNESLKATLVWTDFPSTPAAAINLVNDLDLEVKGPAGTFLGNVFSGGASQTGGNPDRRNTVEQVLLATPGAGTYTVTVRAFNVPVGPQPFSLILTGDVSLNQPPICRRGRGPDRRGRGRSPARRIRLDRPGRRAGPPLLRLDPDRRAAGDARGRRQRSGHLHPDNKREVRLPPAGERWCRPGQRHGHGDRSASTVLVFSDDFELDRSWTADPSGTDTAFTGRWERAVPQATSNKGLPLQLGAARSGTHDLVTGAAAGNSVGANDIDGGVSSIVSPPIELPTGQITLSLAFYLAHLANSSDDDFLRVQVLGTTTQTVLQELGCGTDRGADWQSTSVDISAFSGHTVRILIDAADAPRASLVEAAVDDVTIETLF